MDYERQANKIYSTYLGHSSLKTSDTLSLWTGTDDLC